MAARPLNAGPDALPPGLQEAVDALNAGRGADALQRFQDLATQAPAHPWVQGGLGLSLAAGGRWDEAVPALREAVRLGLRDERADLTLLRALLAIDAFEAAADWGRVLADPARARSPALAAELRRVDTLMRARLQAHRDFQEARLETLHHNLPLLLQAMPRWAAGFALQAAVQYQLSPALGPCLAAAEGAEPPAGDGADALAALGAALADARRADLLACRAAAERALALAPTDGLAERYRLRAAFGLGDTLAADRLAVLAEPGEADAPALPGPAPLHAGADWTEAVATQAAQAIEVDLPASCGERADWARACGRTRSHAGFALRLPQGEARGGSDVVCAADGRVLHALLSHPLAPLANAVHDKAVRLRAADRLWLSAPRERRVLAGSAVSLLGVSTRQYGHWLFEHLTRLRHLEGCVDWARTTVLVDAGMPDTHHQALRQLLGAELRVQVVEAGCAVQAEQLWIAGGDVFFPHYAHQSVPDSVHIAPAFAPALADLRARMTRALPPCTPQRRLFVRRSPSLRALLNQDAVQQHLVDRWGFEVIEPERLDFPAQLRAFAEAAWVVGPHGSGLSNAVFCAPGARMLTLCNGAPGNLPAWAAALHTLGVQHRFVVGVADAASHGVRHHHDFAVDLAVLDQALTAWADGPLRA